MATIRKIVIGVDFSLYSHQALECGADVAAKAGAEIVAVSVINKRLVDSVERVFVSEGRAFSLKRFLADETYRRTQSLKELMDEMLPEHVARRMVIRAGIPFEELLVVIDEEQADLVIMNPKGNSKLTGLLFGSNAEKLFRHSPIPVLALNSTTY